MHEILTLQLGQRSNYLATHFWNTQESYFTYSADEDSPVDHDVHFRPGIGADGAETFTPRTVIYDLKGGFGSMRKINALYEIEEAATPQALWNGPTSVQRQPAISQHAYQESLEQGTEPPKLTTETVRYWSDFNRVFFHPRSIVQLNEYELQSSLMPFERWDVGEELFSSLDKEHDLLDRDLRPFAEEADHLQGIQIMTTVDDSWGGFSARYLDRIRDEYGKLAVWNWGMEDTEQGVSRDKKLLRMANTARSVAEISPQATVYIPMGMPSTAALPQWMQMDSSSVWHTSGLFSAAQESITLPSRLKAVNGYHQTLDDLSVAFNVNGNQNISRLQMSIHDDSVSVQNGYHEPGDTNGVTSESLDSRIHSQVNGADGEATFDIDLFPREAEIGRGRSFRKTHTFGQTDVFRGDDYPDEEEDGEQDGFERARRRAVGLTIVNRTRTPLAYPILSSYPGIFKTPNAENQLSIHTSLSTDSSVSLRLKNLRTIVQRTIGLEEREALSNTLGELAEAYEEGWDSGSDEDDE